MKPSCTRSVIGCRSHRAHCSPEKRVTPPFRQAYECLVIFTLEAAPERWRRMPGRLRLCSAIITEVCKKHYLRKRLQWPTYSTQRNGPKSGRAILDPLEHVKCFVARHERHAHLKCGHSDHSVERVWMVPLHRTCKDGHPCRIGRDLKPIRYTDTVKVRSVWFHLRPPTLSDLQCRRSWAP